MVKHGKTMCVLVCVEGVTFLNVIIGELGWLNMERPCVYLCSMSSS
jgi:hypothetical protein